MQQSRYGPAGRPFPGWVGRHAKDMDPASGDLQHEPHVQALEQDGLSMEEVAGQGPSAWAARNCCQVRLAPGCRVDTASSEEQPHRARCDLLSKLGKFTVDASVAPGGFSAAIRRIRRRSSGTVEGRPGWRCGYLQRRLIRSRCQRSNVSGVTNRWSRCCFGGGGSTPRGRPGLARRSVVG
jgi:hypothetical protein